MLPSMTAQDYGTLELTKDDLTDEVICNLFEIVRRAESSPDKSSRAVFTAYQEVLNEAGLSTSEDVVLHRFLFRMQRDRRRDEGLMDRFKRVLKDSFEIDVEIDENGEGIEVTTDLDAGRPGAQSRVGRHSRRGSFDSFFDATADKIAGTEYGDLPLRPRSESQGEGPDRHRRNRSAQMLPNVGQYPGHYTSLPIRNKRNNYGHTRSLSGQQWSSRRRNSSVSSRGSLQIRRGGHASATRAAVSEADDELYSDEITDPDLSNVRIPGINAAIPDIHGGQRDSFEPEPYRPSDTLMLDEAASFEHQRLHRMTRTCLCTWHNRTQALKTTQRANEHLATAFDARVLLRLGFEQLRDTLRLRQSIRETDRFFTRLESRADRARNLFLLTKAFTHWAKSTEDEVLRTSVARRHILRTRFFNGWRDITAVNELKVQHFVLGKFLRQWRERTRIVLDNAEFALQLYEENLVHRVYKEWFFRFCAIAAPAWRNDRIRRVMLSKWSEISTVLQNRERWASDWRGRTVAKQALQGWQRRAVALRTQRYQAEEYRQRSLLSLALNQLRVKAQLNPVMRDFQARVQARRLRTTFQEWHRASQLSRQAKSVDRLRIMRNAYTAWNDRLRIKALEDRINDRLLVECLYKLTLASRVSLFQRVHNRQSKESIFLTWVTKTNERTNSLDAAERRFAQFKHSQLLRSCLHKMETLTANRKAEEFAVMAEAQHNLKARMFQKLLDQKEHLQQLNQWSTDARFYVLSKRTLQVWSEATQHARRNRRRETYAQVRRTLKVNLVRRAFESWRSKAAVIADQILQANEVANQRLLSTSAATLRRWHDRTKELQEKEQRAQGFYSFKLASRYFHTWSQRMQNYQDLHSQAVALRQESAEIAALSALKKLGWRLWNNQRQEENARALYERNFEKHVRFLLRYWSEKTTDRQIVQSSSPTPRRKSGPVNFGDNGELGTTLLEVDNDHDFTFSSPTNPYTTTPAVPPPLSAFQSQDQLQSTSQPLMRPSTYPQPNSAFRPAPPPTIPEHAQIEDDFAAQSTFWSGTPMPPLRAGYLKTPSKRSIARAKRPGLPTSPEKRIGRAGAMSAPPAQVHTDAVLGEGGITSFQSRLQAGGFVNSVGPSRALSKGTGNLGRGKGRVGFGNVQEM